MLNILSSEPNLQAFVATRSGRNMQVYAISQGPVFGLTLLFNTLDLLVSWPKRRAGEGCLGDFVCFGLFFVFEF